MATQDKKENFLNKLSPRTRKYLYMGTAAIAVGAFAFGLSAEIERNLISQRTREALARLKAEGKHIGRPKGSRTRKELNPLYRKEEYIRKALQSGRSKRSIAKSLHCSRNTLRRYILQNDL